MRIQVLVSTMNQSEETSIIEKMNIQSDAIIVNQCEKDEIKEFKYNNQQIKFLSFAEKGVGLSRNNALMRADADICLMADDDMVYVDGYEEIVLKAFEENPKADMIMFNVPIKKIGQRDIVKVKKNGKVNFFNALKFGTVNIAFKREKIYKSNIYFSLLFGGGAKYSCGEDSLFIVESLKKKLKIYQNENIIATIEESESSWFKGYNEKYFYDKGVLFASLIKYGPTLLALQFVLRHRKLFAKEMQWKKAYKIMIQGIKNMRSN